MKTFRGFVMMGVAMLAACIAFAAPAGAADRMHDPGLYPVSVSTPDQPLAHFTAQDDVLIASEVAVISTERTIRSIELASVDLGRTYIVKNASFIDPHMRC